MLRPFSSKSSIPESRRSNTSWLRRRCSAKSPTNSPFSSSRRWYFSSSRFFSSRRNFAISTSESASFSSRPISFQRLWSWRRSSTASVSSTSFRSPERCSYCCAREAWRSSGFSCRSISAAISCTRASSASMFFSLRAARSLRILCFKMPAASSTSTRRSSGRPCSTFCSEPWLMMECASRPSPESFKMSMTSMRREGLPLIRYSLSPLRYMRRVTTTSVKSSGRVPSELSSTRSTSAKPTACLAELPANMTSSIDAPRRCLALCSPKTHKTASEMLDLPEPLGPTTTVRPGSRRKAERSANDLKPFKTRDLRYTKAPWTRRCTNPEMVPRTARQDMKPRRAMAAAAAAASAAFLERPSPQASSSPSTETAALKVRACGGPLSPTMR